MSKFKRILVPTDFSNSSLVAIKHAALLASQNRAKIYLVHVMEPAPVLAPTALGISTETFERRMTRETKRVLEKFARKFGKRIAVETVLRKGNVEGELLAVAKSKRVDLIVMSTHGRTGIGHVLVGSVAEKIVRLAPCPVLTVKPSK